MELDDRYWQTEAHDLSLLGRVQTASAFLDMPWPAAAIPWLLESLDLARRDPEADRYPLVYALRHVPPTPAVVLALLREVLDGTEKDTAVDALGELSGEAIERWSLSSPLPVLRGALPCDADAIVALIPDTALPLLALLAPYTEAAHPPLRAALDSDDLLAQEIAVRALKPPPERADVSEILRRLREADALERIGALGVSAHGALPWLGEIAGDGYENYGRRQRAREAADAITEDCRRFRPWFLARLRDAVERGHSLHAARLVWAFARMERQHVQLIGALRFNRMPALEAARTILAANPVGNDGVT